jgi:hypothetical protein
MIQPGWSANDGPFGVRFFCGDAFKGLRPIFRIACGQKYRLQPAP